MTHSEGLQICSSDILEAISGNCDFEFDRLNIKVMMDNKTSKILIIKNYKDYIFNGRLTVKNLQKIKNDHGTLRRIVKFLEDRNVQRYAELSPKDKCEFLSRKFSL